MDDWHAARAFRPAKRTQRHWRAIIPWRRIEQHGRIMCQHRGTYNNTRSANVLLRRRVSNMDMQHERRVSTRGGTYALLQYVTNHRTGNKCLAFAAAFETQANATARLDQT